MFVCLMARLKRSRRLWAVAAAAVLLGVAPLVLVNFVPPVAAWAHATPGLSRFVFSSGPDASALARIGIWRAGIDTLRHAPWPRQLFGYGLDAAHVHYFAYLPTNVLAIDGYLETIDRLHNEVLEIAAGTGFLGLVCYLLFFAGLTRAAAAALSAPRAGESVVAPWRDWPVALAAGGCGALVAWGLSGSAMVPAGFGIGLGLGWAVGLLMATGAQSGTSAVRQLWVAALAATLLGFWFDLQASVPVLATRLVFFAEAALLLRLAAPVGGDEPAEPAESGRDNAGFAGWCAGVVLVAGTVGFYAAPFGGIFAVTAFIHGGLPLLLFVVCVAVAWFCLARERARIDAPTAAPKSAYTRTFIGTLARVALPFALGYAALAVLAMFADEGDREQMLAAPVLWAWAWLCGCALLFAAWRGRWQPRGSANWRALTGMVAGGVLLVLALALAWAQLRGDMAERVAGILQYRGDGDAAQRLMERAADTLPRETQFRQIAGTQLLARTVAVLERAAQDVAAHRGGLDRAQAYALRDQLRQSETDLRIAAAQAPDDAWANLGLANTLQFEGRRDLRALIGEEEGAAKAAEARERFARASALYPAQPTIVRNWAQFEFEQGNRATAYRLFDRMEALMPGSIEPFAERIRNAGAGGDEVEVAATLERARTQLGEAAARQLAAGAPLPASGAVPAPRRP
jgi:hypothetical protein